MKNRLAFILALPRVLFQDLLTHELSMRSMGLAFTTLLSLTPLLALSFSVLKGFGVHNQLEPVLMQLMSPMGSKAEELTEQVLSFVDNMQVGVLGVLGLGTLLYTVVSLMQQVETAFNRLWYVQHGRSWFAQFRDYLSVVMVSPILMFIVIGLLTSFSNMQFIQNLAGNTWWTYVLKLVPVLLLVFIFTFAYIYMPNTSIRFLPALGAAAITAIVWQTGSWIFASFVVSSGQQTAIYSIFAGLFLFMLWLHIGWLIILLGARLSFYFQYPEAVFQISQPENTSLETRELLAASILRDIGNRYSKGETPPTLNELYTSTPVSRLLIRNVLHDLMEYGILSQEDTTPPRYLLRVAPDAITVGDIRRSLWQGDSQQRKQAERIRTAGGWTHQGFDAVTQDPNATLKTLLTQRDSRVQQQKEQLIAQAEAEQQTAASANS